MRLAVRSRARPRPQAAYKTAECLAEDEKSCEQEEDAVAVKKAQAAKKRKARKAAKDVEQESQENESSKTSNPAAKKRRAVKRAKEQDNEQDPISAALQFWVDSLDAKETAKRKAKKKAKPAARQTGVKQAGTKAKTPAKKNDVGKVAPSAATAAEASKNDYYGQAAVPGKICKAKVQDAAAAAAAAKQTPQTEAKPSSSKSAKALVERRLTLQQDNVDDDDDDDLDKLYHKLVMLDPSQRDPVKWDKARREMCKRTGVNPEKRGYDPPDSAFLPGAYKRWCISCENASDNKRWKDVDKIKSTGRCPICYKMNYGYYHY